MTRVRTISKLLCLLCAVSWHAGCGDEQPSQEDTTGDAGEAADARAGAVDAASGCSTSTHCLADATSPSPPAMPADADAGSAPPDASQPDAAGEGSGNQGGELCGGFAGFQCAAGLFCDYAAGTGCEGIADASGQCSETPGACTRDYQPVCGCDRHSYTNPCDAHSHGVSVMRAGLCTAEDCSAIGGRVEASNGASTPSCATGEASFALPGREQTLCCVP